MSDDDSELFSSTLIEPSENIVVVKGKEKVTRKKKSVTIDESKAKTLERLEKQEVTIVEARAKAKQDRALAKEDKALVAKVEKVNKVTKNDDLFEKKYANQFERFSNILTNVEIHLSETNEIKKKKQSQREEERILKEKAIELVKEDLTKIQEAEAKIRKTDEDAKLKVVEKAKDVLLVKTSAPSHFLPNYRTMNFGRKR